MKLVLFTEVYGSQQFGTRNIYINPLMIICVRPLFGIHPQCPAKTTITLSATEDVHINVVESIDTVLQIFSEAE